LIQTGDKIDPLLAHTSIPNWHPNTRQEKPLETRKLGQIKDQVLPLETKAMDQTAQRAVSPSQLDDPAVTVDWIPC
jgi:hypothetical protein